LQLYPLCFVNSYAINLAVILKLEYFPRPNFFIINFIILLLYKNLFYLWGRKSHNTNYIRFLLTFSWEKPATASKKNGIMMFVVLITVVKIEGLPVSLNMN
jgi:hypothetical protein